MTNKTDIEQLFRNHYAAMFTSACRLLRDDDAARDIVHDVFASLLLQDKSNVTLPFLMNGVRFRCLNYIRNISIRDRIHHLYAIDLDEIEEAEWPDDEIVARFNRIVDSQLSEQCRRVVRARFTAGLSYREIAGELNISEQAVYKHLRHALNVLRNFFHQDER